MFAINIRSKAGPPGPRDRLSGGGASTAARDEEVSLAEGWGLRAMV